MSGAGKSTLLRALAERGYKVVDTDYDGWTLPDGRWDASKMSVLLDREPRAVVAGTVDHQVDFYHRFDHVVLLSAPLDVPIERVSSRTANPYGKPLLSRQRSRSTSRLSSPGCERLPLSSWTDGRA